ALIGRAVLDVFSIRLASLSVAGGILFLILAIQMLNAEPEPAPDSSSSDPNLPESAIVPLGVPLMAGPGAISTVILNSPGLTDPITTGLLILAIAGVGLSTWLCFTFSDQIVRLVGPVGIRLLTRLMGLVLAALAIEYIAKGLAGIFPKLFGA
ncbi:MAG: hypothetical protein RL320_972, partial [Pseudomonadota bacterium]